MHATLHTRHAPRRPQSTPVRPLTLLLALLAAVFSDAHLHAARAFEPPAPDAAMAAYQLAERAVRSWTPLPENPDADSLPLVRRLAGQAEALGAAPAPIAGVHLQLRLDGRTIARPALLRASLPPSIDDRRAVAYALLRDCVNAALAQAESRMEVPNDALRDQNLRERARAVRISIELAAPPVPMHARTWADAVVELDPGLHGIAVLRNADRELRPVFPSAMLSSGQLPARSLSALIAATIGEGGAAAALDQPAKVAAEHQLTLLRFRTTHLAQGYDPSGVEDATPSFLFRGARTVPLADIRLDSLRTAADRAAEHLIARLEPATRARPVTADLRPWLNPSSPSESAETHELALAALALANHASAPSVDASLADSARQTARAVLHHCRANLIAQQDPDPIALALVVVATSELDPTPTSPDADSQTTDFWLAWDAAVDTLFTHRPDAAASSSFDPALPPPVRGLLSEAIARRAVAVGSPDRLAQADAAVSAAFASVTADQLVSLMPWLSRAAAILADHARDDTPLRSALPSAVALRDMRERIWNHQLQLADAGADAPDFVGGIVFTAPGASPLPTWQCFRPIVSLARALADERLTDEPERARELARLGNALRFVRQLQTDEHAAWSATSPRLVLGGFRAAPWDHAMPIDASSFGLLCLSESIRSLSALSDAPNDDK